MRLKQIDIPKLARIEIEPLDIAITGEEILADLWYPEPRTEATGR
jgi:hypothetical protein